MMTNQADVQCVNSPGQLAPGVIRRFYSYPHLTGMESIVSIGELTEMLDSVATLGDNARRFAGRSERVAFPLQTAGELWSPCEIVREGRVLGHANGQHACATRAL